RSRGRQPLHFLAGAALDDAACADEAHRGRDGFDQAHRIDAQELAEAVVAEVEREQMAEADAQRGAARYEHVRAQARRAVRDLALDADDAAEEHRGKHAAKHLELHLPVTEVHANVCPPEEGRLLHFLSCRLRGTTVGYARVRSACMTR